MFFIILLILIFITYCVLCKSTKKEKFKFYEAFIPLIFFSIICSVALCENYLVCNLGNEGNQRIAINFLSYWIIGKSNISNSLLKFYFNCSIAVNVILIIIYSTLKILED